jgi:CheY-like chemotaxis protein
MPGKTTLLIVDDDRDVLTVLKTKLELTGRFEVLTALGGEEALRHAREAKPDLVVCDIDMPDMDGGELAAALKESRATAAVPVVFLSALVAPEDSARGVVGGWPMLSKRSSVDQLVKKIDELLATSPR